MNPLLVLACSQTKSDDPGTRLSARQRYRGPLWLTLEKTDPEGRLARVAFLSALEGFKDASWTVDRYDRRMTAELAARMIEQGIGARYPEPKPGTAGGLTASSCMASISRWGDAPFDEVCLVGGHLYLSVMRAYFEEFRARGYVSPDAKIVEINGQIGYMRRDLRNWLLSGSPDAQPCRGAASAA